jgi:hypothetical protein
VRDNGFVCLLLFSLFSQRKLTSPNDPRPSISILAHLTMGLFGSEESIFGCGVVWGIVGIVVSVSPELVCAYLGFTASALASLVSTIFLPSEGW